MTTVSYTLVAEGPTDAALMPAIDWLWRQLAHPFLPKGAFLDPREPPAHGKDMPDRIACALELLPCDVLFVHRDADAGDPDALRQEIRDACSRGLGILFPVPHVCVVPVRMTEAWLMFSEGAVRGAAGNPNGTMPIQLPGPAQRAESLADPKTVLNDALRAASGLQGRRRRRFSVSRAKHRIPGLIDDFSPLREFRAFQLLEEDVRTVAADLGGSDNA